VAADAGENTSWDTSADIGLPQFEQCIPIEPPEGMGHFDHAIAVLDRADLPFSHGPRARVAGYVRPVESRPIDAPWLGMVLDWFPPASFTRIDPPAGGTSITYSVHVHHTLERLSTDEWLGGVFHVDISAHGGLSPEKGLVTDSHGLILASRSTYRWTAGPDQLRR
jgi:hypothetical protein